MNVKYVLRDIQSDFAHDDFLLYHSSGRKHRHLPSVPGPGLRYVESSMTARVVPNSQQGTSNGKGELRIGQNSGEGRHTGGQKHY